MKISKIILKRRVSFRKCCYVDSSASLGMHPKGILMGNTGKERVRNSGQWLRNSENKNRSGKELIEEPVVRTDHSKEPP